MGAPGPYSIGADEWNGLSKVAEEAGEIVQVAGKIVGAGGNTIHFDGSNLRERLHEELADIAAAIEFYITQNLADSELLEFQQRVTRKHALFRLWNRDCKAAS